MNRTLAYVIIAVVFVALGFLTFNAYIYNEKQVFAAKDEKNAEYVIDGRRIRLTDGAAEVEVVPGSASTITTRYFGNEVRHDFDKDGREDVVFLLTQETGGSGTFFYVVAAVNTERGYIGSEAYLLGDRIAPQPTNVDANGNIIVNFAERAPGEPMTARPSMGKTVRLRLDPQSMQFGIVANDFEGEADPSRMTLGMNTWTWISALYNDGRELKPKQPGAFTLAFGEDGRFSAKTDCNSISGQYETRQSAVTFSEMVSTKMYCEGSQEGDFAKLLEDTASYHFTSKGELILELKYDSGTVSFR